ncbi:MAG: tRNA uridine-5-carboxymethylaminomethyl(34) synthesis GTPase MnmE [Firmicutes bacterium]|nr:tRNA uridine-5-carboxymethylaminomethyl(34) synthesis GTPase MnmE [Bacillota bacterium]MCL1953840.1 tRNA uridine-5-carboxymethylaminomethyl(34) synthesis GTPase MnmE [Bacillota bacterium]
MKTIVALATPQGRGGVAIVRISGVDAHLHLDKIFETKYNQVYRKLYHGKVVCKDFCDSAMAVKFVAPYSYTGENVAEIHCHGSPIVTTGILQQLIDNGCFVAEKGEFTKRALLNGKLDLLQAEGVLGIINADTTAQVVQSNLLLDGALSIKIDALQTRLLDCIASIEVALDYPEEGLELDTVAQLQDKLTSIQTDIYNMLADYKRARLIKDGVKVVLLGKPNVGKSSLLNALVGYERAIVDSVEGTTRDVVEDSFAYNGVKFLVYDTAGVRDTDNLVEQQGVQRTHIQAKDGDILVCFDEYMANDIRSVLVSNKCDLNKNIQKKDIENSDRLFISAKNGINIDKLKSILYNKSIHSTPNHAVINTIRHYNSLRQAYDSIELALSSLHSVTLDCIAIDVRQAWESVKSLTGQAITDDILETIFSQFCVGK